MKTLFCLLLKVSVFTLYANLSIAQAINIERVEPSFWWIGMKNTSVQLLVNGKDISKSTVSLSYPGVIIKEVFSVENPNYIFITLSITSQAQAGKLPLIFKKNQKTFIYPYELRNKSAATNRIQGFNPSDVIYLIMPNRFANGNTANDHIKDMLQGVERNEPFGRHGGDLKGIDDHLDYIQELGVTAIWLNPVQENDQVRQSYHR